MVASNFPIESMTGFAEFQIKLNNHTYSCKIKSVNHRYFDLKLKMPRVETLSFELPIRNLMQTWFKRGSIELLLQVDADSLEAESQTHIINEAVLMQYVKELTSLERRMPSDNRIDFDLLIRLPGVCQPNQFNNVDTSLGLEQSTLINEIILPTIKRLKESRLNEGLTIKSHLTSILAQIRNCLAAIIQLEGEEKERLRSQLKERVEATLKLFSTSPSAEFNARLNEEAAFWLDRKDFEEEKMRFTAHCDLFESLLNQSKEPAAKKLEFTLQEMLREVNTLSVKSQSAKIIAIAIEMKSLIEKLKEQAANVQ